MATNIFGQIRIPRLKKSVFDLSYNNAFTANFGKLYPIYVDSVVPGDRYMVSSSPFVKLDALSAPIMGKINVTIHHFFVPYRIIWDNWEKFITGGSSGTATPAVPFIPYTVYSDAEYPELFEYLNFGRTRTTGTSGVLKRSGFEQPKVDAMNWRAYLKIYDEYYRDQNLEDSLFDEEQQYYVSTGDGNIYNLPGSASNKTLHGLPISSLRYRAWRKDLFTSALPWAQRGVPVEIPLKANNWPIDFVSNDIDKGTLFASVTSQSSPNSNLQLKVNTLNPVGTEGVLKVKTNVGAGFNIEDLREASALQRFLEHNAIGGARYKEQIAVHFAEIVPDYRLDIPEYLGGVTTPVQVGSVFQTSSGTDSVVGDYAGQGTAAGSMRPYNYRVREHGVIMGILSITPQAYYSQGVPRMNMKFDKLDHFFPEFENLGEQEILNNEIYATATSSGGTFGYGPRFYEYKTRDNEIHGDFRHNKAYWIPQRIFSSLPALNSDFIQVNPSKEASLNNIFAVTDAKVDQFNVLVSNTVRAIRPMSKYSKFSFS